LLDGDLGLANIDIQLGVMPKLDLLDVLAHRATIAQCVMTINVGSCHSNGSFGLLLGHSGVPSLTTLGARRIQAVASSVRDLQAYGIIAWDLCAGIDATTRRLIAAADTPLVVATGEPTALTDTYAVVKVHKHNRVMLGYATCLARLVINQATTYRNGMQIYQKLAHACGSFLRVVPPLAGIYLAGQETPCGISA